MTQKKKIHPLVSYHYLPRIIGYLLYGVMLGSIFYKTAGMVFWIILGIQTLIWPQIAYFLGRRSSNPKKTEYVNMISEAFFCGIWITVINFSLWPTTALFLGALVNTLASGGFRLFYYSSAALSLSILISGMIAGFHFNPESSIFTALSSIVFIVSYSIIVSIVSYIFSKQVSRKNKEIVESNKQLSHAKDEILVAYEELEAASEQLKTTRDQLWGEMQLAKKIQTILLPEKPEITGYEIAGYMQPAEDVGGDYYDIINVGNKNWIVIGDVSGHGVPAGLIMMMVQTSIHTVLQDSKDISPSLVLSRVNSVIADNIRKLHEDKYMTITVFACMDNGYMHFSGLHQDIMIYKAATNTVEIVETNGTWIGIIDDIENMVDDSTLQLDINDIMLVYTDGLTEAWHKDSQKDNRDYKIDMFGPERTEELLKELGRENPEFIIKNILHNLTDYICSDDITLLLIKRKA